MTRPGPEGSGLSRLAGEVKEYLELQKELGRKFLLWPPKKPMTLKPLGHRSKGPFESLAALAQAVRECSECPLSANRSQAVPGRGPVKTRLMFVGICPGEEDDRLGQPFSGPDGELLTKMIQAIRFRREEVYVSQAVKCRPPEDRPLQAEEIKTCEFFLKEEIGLVNPEILVALGEVPAQILSRSNKTLFDLRGRWLKFDGRSLMAIYHPAFLLTQPGAKREAWEDLKQIRRRYDELETK